MKKQQTSPSSPPSTFRQNNAFAMQHGLLMAIWVLSVQFLFLRSLLSSVLSLLYVVSVLLIPCLLVYFTFRFRKQVAERDSFSFTRGATHTLLLCGYTGLWAGLFLFIYLAFLDHGFIFSLYEKKFSTPEFQQVLQQTGMNAQIQQQYHKGFSDLIAEMRTIPAASYAAAVVYMYLVIAPFLSLIAGLLTMRRTLPTSR